MDELKVVELFAGVGGFRVGLERASARYKVVWSNQWEPARKKQEASNVYVARFGMEGHSNEDISTVEADAIPDHDVLVGGFPCQDYSVARSLNQAHGLAGKKGVLWWQIHRILKEKENKPGYLILENVDRLLQSPAKQRGRDFAVMLASLSDLGYAVEWRVINAADYGMPQRRRRIFFLGFHRSTPLGRALHDKPEMAERWMLEDGIFAEAFPTAGTMPIFREFTLEGDLAELTDHFNTGPTSGTTPFANSGLMVQRHVRTMPSTPAFYGPRTTLGHILQPEEEVPEDFFLDEDALARWDYMKGSKKEMRKSKEGFAYHYAEGAMTFPDALDKPSRTIITAEGGAAPSRFKHVVQTPTGRLRRLTPVELERLNMFPDNHTAGLAPARRAFLMGNALVTGIVERVGALLAARIKN